MMAEEDHATLTDSTGNITPKTVRTGDRNEFVYSPSVYDRPQRADVAGGGEEDDSDGKEGKEKKESGEFVGRGECFPLWLG